jgi:hypothetical protein
MSKFSKILKETLRTIEEAVDPSMANPNIDPATGMPLEPIPPAGPEVDAENLADDESAINSPWKLKLIELAKALFYIHPDDVLKDTTMATMVDKLDDQVTNMNADEQLSALDIIARDSIGLDTGLKSSADGAIDR